MRILIYGAGAVGSTYAAKLKDSGYDVTVLARGKRYQDISARGLILEDAMSGKRLTTKVAVINKLRSNDIYDYIIVCVRSNQLASILPILASNKSPCIIFMSNNLSGPDELIKAVGRERVILGFPSVGGQVQNGVAVVKIFDINLDIVSTTLGELDGKTTVRLKQISETLKSAGFYVRINSQMIDWLMTHGTFVIHGARVLAKNNYDNYQLAQSPMDIKLGISLIREGFRIIEKRGYRITPAKYRLIYLPMFILVPLFRLILNSKFAEVSMAWYCKDAPDEFEYLEKEFARLTLPLK